MALISASQELEVSLTFRQEYNDSRLATGDDCEKAFRLGGEDADTVWQPDVFIRNSRSVRVHGGEGMSVNALAKVGECGNVYLSKRITAKLACFGMREQLKTEGKAVCPVQLASCK